MKELMKKMSMILLAIIGTLVGLGPLVLMASVNTARHRNAKRYQFARQQLTTTTEGLKHTMAGVDTKRAGPDKMAQAQIRQLHLAYHGLQHETGKRLFRPDEPLFPNSSNPMIYSHKEQFNEAKAVLREAARWVDDHIGNYVNCDYCEAHGVSRSDTCPQTLQPSTQTDVRGEDIEVFRNVPVYGEDENGETILIRTEEVSHMEASFTPQGKNHRGNIALDWAKGRYDRETIEVALKWIGTSWNGRRMDQDLQALARKYDTSARDGAV
tara:strand:- start:3231 stop:4034 length:804 start_codon:yes stop_codon:yes gene_type:complete